MDGVVAVQLLHHETSGVTRPEQQPCSARPGMLMSVVVDKQIAAHAPQEGIAEGCGGVLVLGKNENGLP